MTSDHPAGYSEADHKQDVKVLHGMGYAQELERRMGLFSNFAISFSIICILSGGINSLAQSISGVGGAGIFFGWPLGCLVSLVFAVAMGQIASAYPTAGGLYHWGSILGNTGLGWLTAWLNLLGLITVLGAINVGTWTFFAGAFGPALGIEATFTAQLVFMIVVTGGQALVNHFGIRVTSLLTDFSGYLIFFGAIALTIALLAVAPSYDFSRLVTFSNFSGAAGGDVWPETSSILFLFLLGLLHPIYTITGYDASAHTSEETRQAAVSVPRGMVGSVIWSALFGWIFLIAIVLAIPDMTKAAGQGWNVFFWLFDEVMPPALKVFLYVVVFLAQLLCGLATVTSASRMIFAFARDDGLPFSGALKRVSPTHRTPVAAIWTGAALAVLFTAYTPVYSTVVSSTVILLFMSCALPIALGLLAYKKTWTQMGPWDLGAWFPVFAVLSILGVVLIFLIGIQPPNDKALWITVGVLIVTAVIWYGFERKRFKGPPIGEAIARRQAVIREAERAVGEIN